MTVELTNIIGDVKLKKQFDVINVKEGKETFTLYFKEGGVLTVNKNEWEFER